VKYIILFLCFSINSLVSQDMTDLKLKVLYGEQELGLDTSYPLFDSTDSIKLSKLKFYVTGLQCYLDSTKVYDDKEHYYLLDLADSSTLSLPLPQDLVFDKLSIDLGVDSLTNHAGAQAGALDPMHGMYWAWQSGYINFKLEGTSPILSTRKNKFQLHLGGYLAPYQTQKTIEFDIVSTEKDFSIALDLQNFINLIELKSNHSIMSPSLNSVQMSEYLAKCFAIIYD